MQTTLYEGGGKRKRKPSNADRKNVKNNRGDRNQLDITRKPDYYLDEDERPLVDKIKAESLGGQGDTANIYAKYSYMKQRNREKQKKKLKEREH